MEKEAFKNSIAIRDTEIQDNLRSIALYHQYIAKMLPKFLSKLETINSIIKRLQKNGKVSQYVSLNARIKSQFSAQTKSSQKAKINDVLGIEIIAATEKELNTILNSLDMFFTIVDEDEYNITTKNIKKKNRI